MRLLLKLYSIYKMCSSTRIQLFLKTEIFSVLAFCPHENGVAGTINTVFQKRAQERSFARSSLIHRLIVDGRKTEVFEFDDVINHILFSVRNAIVLPSF